MSTTYTIRVINQTGAAKSYFLFMQPPTTTALGGEAATYANVLATFDNVTDGDHDSFVYTVETAKPSRFVVTEGAATPGEVIVMPGPANFATVDFTDHAQTTADVTQQADDCFSVAYVLTTRGLAAAASAMDIAINFINQSNDANTSQVVIFGDDGDTPVATHSVRVPPRTAVRVTHSSLPSGGRLEVSPTGSLGSWLGGPSLNAPLHGCVVIDATSPDGYLDNARAGNPLAGAIRDVAEAVRNLAACATPSHGSSPASIVGHGTEGLIAVGCGLSPAPGQELSLETATQWTPQLAQLKGLVSSLALYGVQVGAGQNGADLLFQIAQVIDAPVYGPTGLLYCDSHGNFMLEPGAVWQMATPTQRPAPIDPPMRTQPLERPSANA